MQLIVEWTMAVAAWVAGGVIGLAPSAHAAGDADEPAITADFAPTTADFPNPDRGFYGWSGRDFVGEFDLASVREAYSKGWRLVHAGVSLADYRDADLPGSFLSALNDRLSAVRSAGMKVTLLFAYDFTGAGHDATAARIKRHLEQLRPVLAANADVIPYMRAGFIGAWGEWHSSKSGNSCGYGSVQVPCETARANRAIVRDALLANVPTTTQIAFRYPADLQRWYPASGEPARVAAHNDCFLAGPSDAGTFTDPRERQYLQRLTAHAAFGGETCENVEAPVRSTCDDILAEGAQYHLAWLNSSYAPSVLDAWRTGGCYDTVSRTMGYRLQLDHIAHGAAVARGDVMPVWVDLRNVGWARMFVARQLVVTLRHRTSGATIKASAGDLATMPAQAASSTRILVNVPIPRHAATGRYQLLLSAPDVFAGTRSDARFAVRFANAERADIGQTWNARDATLSTGTVVQVK